MKNHLSLVISRTVNQLISIIIIIIIIYLVHLIHYFANKKKYVKKI